MDFAMQADGATSVVSALDPVLDPVSVKPRYKQDRRPRLTQVNMNFRLGRRIRYSGSSDNTIRLWNAAAGVETTAWRPTLRLRASSGYHLAGSWRVTRSGGCIGWKSWIDVAGKARSRCLSLLV